MPPKNANEPASLVVSRTRSGADSLRAYHLVLDGRPIGTIRRGETKSYPIQLGTHSLSAKIDWCQTPEQIFVVSDHDIAFTVESNLKGLKILLALPMLFFPRSLSD